MNVMTKITNNRIIFIIILLGLSIRLLASFLPGFKIDMDAWFSWAIRLNQVGFSNFYSDQLWTNYTPGFLYILSLLAGLKNLLQLSDSVFYLIIKYPSILAEILLGLFVYFITFKKSINWAYIGTATVLLNPAFLFNSSIWGQVDGLLSLLMVLSIYFLIQQKIIISSAVLGLSFLVKPQAISIIPILILYLIRNFSIKNIIQIVLPTILTIFILSLPFFTNQSYGLVQLFSKMISDYSYNSLFAYNLWGAIGFWIKDDNLWNNISYQHWGYILYILYWIFISYLYFKRRLSLYSVAALATLGFFFLPTRVHERYLYPAIIFLIILMTVLKSRLILILTILLSLIHFLNLYYVYVYYNELYLNLPKILYNQTLYNFLDKNGNFLSMISTAIFILTSIGIIKSHEHSKKD